MSNFLIFKAAFNNSATPAVGTYTAEGATARFNRNTGISPDYYLYNTVLYSAVQWFIPTAETTDFEFVADILTRGWDNRITYFIIADSTGTTRLRMWSVNDNWHFENSDSTATTGSPEYIGTVNPTTSGGFGVFHQFRVRVRKLTASSSSVEIYVDGTLKLTATAGAALVTCAKIGFVGGVNSFGPGTGAGIKNAYVYDLSGGDVIDRGVLSGAFNRFISWMKSKFALKSDIPTVNDATLTIQRNGTTLDTFTANASVDKTINISTADDTKIPLAGSNAISGSLIPATTDAYDLGTSTKKWKSLNGINPGVLSYPNKSSYINIDTTNWDLTCSNQGVMVEYVAEKSGWLLLQIRHGSADIVDLWVVTNSIRINSKSTLNTLDNRNFNMISLPLAEGETLRIFGNASQYVAGRTVDYARIYIGLGNV